MFGVPVLDIGQRGEEEVKEEVMHLPERQELHGVVGPVHAVLDAPVQPGEVLPRDGLVAGQGQHVVEEVLELVLGGEGLGRDQAVKQLN